MNTKMGEMRWKSGAILKKGSLMLPRSPLFKQRITLQKLGMILIATALVTAGSEQIARWVPAAKDASTALAGAVTHVRDGDTIEVEGIAVRISNLDCAELDTVEGEAAKIWMAELLAGSRVDCLLTGRKSYDRELGTCRFGGTDLGEIAIGEGVCARWID